MLAADRKEVRDGRGRPDPVPRPSPLVGRVEGGRISVIDVPADLVTVLGGRRQYRVSGTLAGAAFSGSGMLVAGGGYCIGLSKAALTAAGASIGDEVDVVISRA
jgi:hypothetical protein